MTPKAPDVDSTLDIALSLVAHTPAFIFPKVPKDDPSGYYAYVKSWVKEASRDPETIATWFTEHPDALIGVYTGRSGIVAVDLDDKGGKSGAASLEQAQLELPATFSYPSRTGDGRHHWYAAPADQQLTIAADHADLEGVDIRSGNGVIVYYGGKLTADASLAPAPAWTLVEGKPADALSAASATLDEWIARTPQGRRSKAVKAAQKAVTAEGMARSDMLAAVSDLVKLGAEPGAGKAYAIARSTYLANYPEHARSWDTAAEGSVKRFGLPPVTIPLTKPEKKALARRREEKSKAVNEKKPAPKDVTPTARDKGRLNPAWQPGRRYPEHSPIAEEIAELLRPTWAYSAGIGVLRYTGKLWEPAEETALIEAVRVELKEIVGEEIKWSVMNEDRSRIPGFTALLNRGQAVSIARFAQGILAESTPELDAHHDLLNVQNGVIDLRTATLLPHDPALMFTKVAGAAYDPDANDPLWTKALEALPSTKVARWMQIRLGQAITGYTPDDAVMPIAQGAGENGKSTLLNAAVAATGNYATVVSDRLLLANPGDHPTELMQLRGVRLAISEELPEGRNLNVKRLKDVMGTAWITARGMRQDNVTWRATHSFFVSTNPIPIVAETDHGTWRRLALVRFPFTFVKPGQKLPTGRYFKQGDHRLRDTFADEPNETVLAWLVAGAKAWYDNNRQIPKVPKAIEEDTLEWRTDADPILSFVRDSLVLDSAYAIPVRQLCDEFNRFLETRSQKRWSDATVTGRFAGHVALPGIEKRTVRASKTTTFSMPLFTVANTPQVAVALVGIRFSTDNAATPPSGEHGEFERIAASFTTDPDH